MLRAPIFEYYRNRTPDTPTATPIAAPDHARRSHRRRVRAGRRDEADAAAQRGDARGNGGCVAAVAPRLAPGRSGHGRGDAASAHWHVGVRVRVAPAHAAGREDCCGPGGLHAWGSVDPFSIGRAGGSAAGVFLFSRPFAGPLLEGDVGSCYRLR